MGKGIDAMMWGAGIMMGLGVAVTPGCDTPYSRAFFTTMGEVAAAEVVKGAVRKEIRGDKTGDVHIHNYGPREVVWVRPGTHGLYSHGAVVSASSDKVHRIYNPDYGKKRVVWFRPGTHGLYSHGAVVSGSPTEIHRIWNPNQNKRKR